MLTASGCLLGSCEVNIGADADADVFGRACQSLTCLTLHFKPPETVSAFIPPRGRRLEALFYWETLTAQQGRYPGDPVLTLDAD